MTSMREPGGRDPAGPGVLHAIPQLQPEAAAGFDKIEPEGMPSFFQDCLAAAFLRAMIPIVVDGHAIPDMQYTAVITIRKKL